MAVQMKLFCISLTIWATSVGFPRVKGRPSLRSVGEDGPLSPSWGSLYLQLITRLENQFQDLEKAVQNLQEEGSDGNVVAAFHAYLQPAISNAAKGHVVTFNKMTLNVGNSYDAGTGIFTAPVKGIYSFSVKLGTFGRKRLHYWLMKNDSPMDFGWVGLLRSDDGTENSISTTVEMEKGERVWVEVEGSVNGSSGDYYRSSFDGHLVQKLE